MTNQLIYDYYKTNPELLSITLTRYTRIRDYSVIGTPRPFPKSPYIILSYILATACNLSVTLPTPRNSIPARIHPSILPQVRTDDVKGRKPIDLWTSYYKTTHHVDTELPIFVPVIPVGMNFAYCDEPQHKSDSLWQVTTFTKTFDIYTWICLFLAILLFSIVTSKKTSTLYILSILMSCAPSAGVCQYKKDSYALILWLLCAPVIVHFYVGSSTSLLISPPEDVQVSSIGELSKKAYTIVFGRMNTLLGMNKTYNSYSTSRYLSPAEKAVQNLLKSAIVIDDANTYKRTLAYENGYATLLQWPGAISNSIYFNKYIARGNRIKRDERYCYIGKKLVSFGPLYFVFLPPMNKKLANTFQNLVQTGIYQLWANEAIGLSHSNRLQDRLRVISPTNVKNDKDNSVIALKLEGKMLKFFVLWGMCVVFCIIALWAELIWRHNQCWNRVSAYTYN